MLYELIGVVRPGNLAEVKEIVRASGFLILSSGGVVRSVRNWGISALPRKTTKHQARYTEGHYFVMRYDANSKVQDQVRRTLGLDPRMIKFSTVRLDNNKLESVALAGIAPKWNGKEEA